MRMKQNAKHTSQRLEVSVCQVTVIDLNINGSKYFIFPKETLIYKSYMIIYYNFIMFYTDLKYR